MKKFWKKICLGVLVCASVFCVSACGKKEAQVSQDLDGDGQIAAWETLYEAKAESNRVISCEKVVEITSLDGLKAIDGTATNTAYVLKNDIDCGGESILVNLGETNYFYGNNHVISNYNLGEQVFDDSGTTPQIIRVFMYNGAGVYDLRLFMGLDNVNLQTTSSSIFYASNFRHVSILDSVEIKGALNVVSVQDSADNRITLSLLTHENPDKITHVKNVNVYGKVIYKGDEKGGYDSLTIGGIMPSATHSTVIGNTNVDAQIQANVYNRSGKKVKLGMVAGESEGFIHSVNVSGSISANFNKTPVLYCGGLVGLVNNPDDVILGVAEIKNCTSSAQISIEADGDDSHVFLGGIAGYCHKGIINYCVNDTSINGIALKTAKIGGIAGVANYSTLDTLVSRGLINLNNVTALDVAEIAGFSTKGIMKHILATTPITIDNTSRAGSIRLGMATIFEASTGEFDIDAETKLSYYLTDTSPLFNGILIGGTNKVTRDVKCSLTTNIGLRDVYYGVKTVEEADGSGELVPVDKLVTEVPFLFNNLYYLSNYKVTDELIDKTTTTSNIPMTCAVINGSQRVKPAADSVVYRPDWFVKNLGFNYGLNHNEVDLSGVKIDEKASSLNSIKFVLTEEQSSIRYFEKKSYNQELQYFDSFIDDAYIYGIEEQYSNKDEFLSFIVNLIANGVNNSVRSLLLTEKYFIDYSLPAEERTIDFKNLQVNMQTMLGKIYDTITINYLLSNDEIFVSENEELVQKIQCTIEDSAHKYVITFDFGSALADGELYFRYKNPNVAYSSTPESGFYYMANVYFEVL